MSVLYIGKLNEYGTSLCNYLSLANTVVARCSDMPKYELLCEQCSRSDTDNEIIEKYAVDSIVCFEDISDDLRATHRMLSAFLKQGVKRLLYIREKSIFRHRPDEDNLSEIMLREYADLYHGNLAVVNTSVLYGKETMPQYIDDLTRGIISRNTIEPKGYGDEFCDCMHVEDFCKAIQTIFAGLTELSSYRVYEIQSGYPFRLNALIDAYQQRYKQVSTLPYEKTASEIHINPTSIPEWSPEHSFITELPLVFEHEEETNRLLHKARRKTVINKVITVCSVMVIFALVEAYCQFLSVSSDLQFVDLRLLFVAACSLLFGQGIGIGSAFLCSTASVLSKLMGGYKWYVLFYHVDNWIPIAVYFIVAIAIGAYKQSDAQRR